MQDYPFLTNLHKLDKFLDTLKRINVPNKFTYRFLASVGYSSSADRSFLPLMIFLGFLSEDGTPTQVLYEFRDQSHSAEVLAMRLQRAYKDIFAADAYAHLLTKELLVGLFSRFDKSERHVIAKKVELFQRLCELAYMSGTPDTKTLPSPLAAALTTSSSSSHLPASNINLNIALSIPAVSDLKFYEDLFMSLRGLLHPQHQ